MKFNNRNVQISPKAVIGSNVKIGDNTVIYDNVVIGDNSIICNDCVLGEPLNDYYTNDTYVNPVLNIGAGSLIRSHCIFYAGSTIGSNFSSGHRVTIREYSQIGTNCMIGTLSDLQGNLTLGNYCRLYSNVHIAQKSEIGDFVFIYPYCVITNDPHPPSDTTLGSKIGSYTQIGVHSVIIPGIKVGENCLIGANSLINRSVDDYTLITGEAAKTLMDVRKFIAKGGKGRYYPWMYKFERGMPWEGIGYDVWMNGLKK